MGSINSRYFEKFTPSPTAATVMMTVSKHCCGALTVSLSSTFEIIKIQIGILGYNMTLSIWPGKKKI